METRLLDGKKIADQIKAEVADGINRMREKGIVPGLAVVLVGDDPASHVYVRNKAKTCEELGMHSRVLELPADTSTAELLQVIGRLNNDDDIDGVLVQLPLPGQIESQKVLQAIHPAKDVDGLHPRNVGKLVLGEPALLPCTPQGIIEMLKREGIELRGAHAVVVGRSNIVGKPLALLLLREHCTVTICHSRTRDLAAVCRTADILVAAVGSPALITRDFLRDGVVVVDVGTNRIDSEEKVVELFGQTSARRESIRKRGFTLVGDVHPGDPWGVASAVTPVPGGVGPLTIASLMKNTLLACEMRRVQAPLVRRNRVSLSPDTD